MFDMKEKNGIIPKHGGYRKLKSFQIARLVYDVTVRFCNRYVNMRSRTHDQMVQAARSGVQNIAEGSKASGTSKKTELKLTNVARASLEELRLDYEDFLRHRRLRQWGAEDARRKELIERRCTSADDVARWVMEVSRLEGRHGPGGRRGQSGKSTVSTLSTKSILAEISANAVLVLIGVACGLLDRQVASLAESFEKEGGFTERLYKKRTQARRKSWFS